MKWWDPHESYNSNFSESEWQAFQADERSRILSESISSVISSGNVAVVDSTVLRELTFDVRVKMGCYSAVDLQFSWTPFWSAWAISCMIRAQFQYDWHDEDGKIRFMSTSHINEPYLPNNVTFVEDEWGRYQPILRSEKKKEEEKQYELF